MRKDQSQTNKITTITSIKKAPKKDYYPVSLQQEGIWLQSKIDPGSTIWNTSHSWRYQGQLNIDTLKKALRELIRRHTSLRTHFQLKGDNIFQVIYENFSLDSFFRFFDISSCPRNQKESTARSIEKTAAKELYNLATGPLIRFTLIRFDESDHLLVISKHHIISDVTSRQIIWKEWVSLYNNYTNNKPRQLETIDIQYHDYAAWQREFRETPYYQKQKEYWLTQLLGKESAPLPGLDLLIDFPRRENKNKNSKTSTYSIELDQQLAVNLRTFSIRNRVTFSSVFLLAFYILLNKYTGQDDMVIGTLYRGRNIDKRLLDKIIGLFANYVAMRLHMGENATIKKLLAEANKKTRDAYENQDYLYEDLVRTLHPERTSLNAPIYRVVFNMLKIIDMGLDPEGLVRKEWQEYAPENDISTQYDLSLYVQDEIKKINLMILYTKDRFLEETIKRMMLQYTNILFNMCLQPDKKLVDMEIITKAEKQQILHEFNDTDADYPADKTVDQLFLEQVQRTPDYIALVGSSGIKYKSYMTYISYRVLNDKSHRLAYLLKEKGIKPDIIVGLMLERSIEMIIGIFAIVKAGGAYLPIDPDYPLKRIEFMLKDSGSEILLKDKDLTSEAFNNLPKDTPSHLHLQPAPATSLAYIIYTSGSTGKPKGVMIEHWTMVNRLNWMQKRYPIGPGDTILQKTPFTFDVSVWEIFWWSLLGAKVCLLPPGNEKDPRQIREAIARHHVTVMHFVPSMLSLFLEYLNQSTGTGPNRLSSLKQIIASGEALTVSQVKAFKQILYKNSSTRLANLYGPTEATIDVSFYDCPLDTEGEIHCIPIGKPIDNIRLLVLNRKMHLQPLGVVGELCITGDGLARGYLNRPELTSGKFDRHLWDNQDYHDEKKLKLKGTVIHDAEPHPETIKLIKSFCGGPGGGFLEKSPPGCRRQNIYRTGDLARWLPDGNIEFLGRMDNQVKIRGNRIELGEIEARLNQHKGIKESVVTASVDQSGGAILCAYIVSAETPNVEEIRKSLDKTLPGYMVPSYFARVKQIPLTANGKVNREALPGVGKSLLPKKKYTPPGSDVEKRLVEIWKKLLGREKIGIHDSFFELGGHSLTVMNLVLRIQDSFGQELTMAAIFDNPTISGLARLILNREQKQRKFQQVLQEIESMTEEEVRALLQEHMTDGFETLI